MPHATRPLMLAPDAAGIAQAAAILARGGLVAVPTETVYGLAARADNADAVAAIYRAKGRPSFNPLIAHVAGVAQGEALAEFGDQARALAAAFWPGPLTLVLPRRKDAMLAEAVTAGLDTVALRCPAHPAMRALLDACAFPLAAPSANRSGEVSPTRAEHVVASLSDAVDAVLDAGPCIAGLESTIIAMRQGGEWQVLRPGPVTEGEIARVLGQSAAAARELGKIEAPGQLASHYSPGKPVRLNAEQGEADEFHIGFGGAPCDFDLSPAGDLAEAAARLYEALHRAAGSSKPRVSVAPVPEEGIGIAINDRLRRAAA